ncbi:hypothetical protein BDV28DRAFT_35272 [Aspergillus coremiiformis]|uniref:Uncharacterized protein n=1 Tax=Aspergillus coremiiformis TaxID=138285 RepID=A0A5N6Z0D1_9EURO|nr:hypothetical protein BDV28DRAFT_35272 [Aspergillus coremiiformis]
MSNQNSLIPYYTTLHQRSPDFLYHTASWSFLISIFPFISFSLSQVLYHHHHHNAVILRTWFLFIPHSAERTRISHAANCLLRFAYI